MNAGSDYTKARAQAQANADLTGEDQVLHHYGSVWWVARISSFTSRLPDNSEIISRRSADVVKKP